MKPLRTLSLAAAASAGFVGGVMFHPSTKEVVAVVAAAQPEAKEASAVRALLPPHCRGVVRFYVMPDGLQYTDDVSCGGPVRNLGGGGQAQLEEDLLVAGADEWELVIQ